MPKPGGLGRGLDSLLSARQREDLASHTSLQARIDDGGAPAATAPFHVATDRLQANREQPRKRFDEGSLEQLVSSIRSQGIIQPIIVRSDGPNYQIVAGERRWRAAVAAGMQTVPVTVRDDLEEQDLLAVALVENLQREDLNAIEEAEALQRLTAEHRLSHEQIARVIGKSRSAVTNALRLLDLDETVKQYVRDGELKMSHVRPLIGLKPHRQCEIAEQIIKKGWSARQTEQHLARLDKPAARSSPQPSGKETERLQATLRKRLKTDVRIRQKRNGSGELVIPFSDPALFASLLSRWFNIK